MLKKSQFRVLMTLAVLALILTLTNMLLYSSNRSVNAKVSARGQYIQQSLQMQPLYDAMLRNMVGLAAKKNDSQLKGLLASQGITFNVNPNTTNQDTSQKAKDEGKKK